MSPVQHEYSTPSGQMTCTLTLLEANADDALAMAKQLRELADGLEKTGQQLMAKRFLTGTNSPLGDWN
jgi:hypothetical protein